MDKEVVVYYSVIKGNKNESLELKWMKLEPVRQSEVSQKEKSKYINVCIWNLEKWYL